MDSVDDIVLDSEEKMSKSLEFVQQQYAGLRTGKASPSLVENVQVSYYGASVRLRELAGISTPEPRLLVVSPFDPSALPAIEKAIIAANVGVTPLNDGRLIRLPIPELSEERRKDLTKVARQIAEKARVAIRGARQEANEMVKALQKKGGATEDERDQALEDIQKNTDEYIRKVDEACAAKEKEILTI